MNTLKKKYNHRKNKAVTPVLATLLMIAVAAAMSVTLFMWSKGFFVWTANSTGSQQGSQNQAAQSSISIEATMFDTTNGDGTVIVHNVGAVAVTLGNLIATGIPRNTGFLTANTTDVSGNTLTKGSSSSIILDPGFLATSTSTRLASGDVVTIKITSEKGTFAKQSYTVP